MIQSIIFLIQIYLQVVCLIDIDLFIGCMGDEKGDLKFICFDRGC